jgi:hypothetical protein
MHRNLGQGCPADATRRKVRPCQFLARDEMIGGWSGHVSASSHERRGYPPPVTGLLRLSAMDRPVGLARPPRDPPTNPTTGLPLRQDNEPLTTRIDAYRP